MAKMLVALLCLAIASVATAEDAPLVPGVPTEFVLSFDAATFKLFSAFTSSGLSASTGNCKDTTCTTGVCAAVSAAATNITATLNTAANGGSPAPFPFTIDVAAKKSAQGDFAVFYFDLSNSQTTALLTIFQGAAALGGNPDFGNVNLVPTSASIFVETGTGFYGDFSPSYFLNSKGAGTSTKLGVQTSSTTISASSIVLAIEVSVFDLKGNYLTQVFGVYPASQLTLSKNGLPTLSGIIDTLA